MSSSFIFLLLFSQALVQFRDLAVAVRARTELDGKDLFANGFCNMRIGYSSLQQLDVKSNSERARDFSVQGGAITAPSGFVPMSTAGMQQQMMSGAMSPAAQQAMMVHLCYFYSFLSFASSFLVCSSSRYFRTACRPTCS